MSSKLLAQIFFKRRGAKNVTFLPKRRVENRNSSWVGVIMSQVAKISAFQPQVKNQKNLEWAKRTSDFWFFTSGWKAQILATSDIMTPTNDEFLILHESFWQEWHYYIIVDASWPLYNNCGKNYIVIKIYIFGLSQILIL